LGGRTVELGLIIAREARYLNSIGDAAACIAGYCISRDVSEREFQLERGGQWSKGKSCDTFNPLGPWLYNQRRIARCFKVANHAHRERSVEAEWQYGNDDFSPRAACSLHFAVHDTRARRPDLNRHTTGSRLGHEAASLSKRGDNVELEIQHPGKQRQSCRQA
jgi:2,4-didehydro-3-deoxy-L-rhamnonate hydrolase